MADNGNTVYRGRVRQMKPTVNPDTNETPLAVEDARRLVRERENEIKLHTLRIMLGINHLPLPERENHD